MTTGGARPAASVLLIVLGAVLLPVGVLGFWVQRNVADTDSYVATVAPLSHDPAVQQAVAAEVTDQLLSAVRRNPALGSVLAPGTALGDAATEQLRQVVSRLAESPQFAAVWTDANRRLQEGTLAALRGEPSDAVRIEGSRVLVSTNVLVRAAQDQLAGSLPFVGEADLSAAGRDIVVVDDPRVVPARTAFAWLDSWGPWLLPLAVLALVSGVLLARNRPRALAVVGALVLAGAGVVALATGVGALGAQRALAGSVLAPAGSAVTDALTSSAAGYVRLLALVGLVVLALGAVGWLIRSRTPR